MDAFNKELDDILGGENKPTTYVAIILDSSGSMASIQNEVTGGLKSQIDMFVEKNKETPIKLSIITFSDTVEMFDLHKSPNEVKEKMGSFQYIPHGMTALCDATGQTIENFDKIAKIDSDSIFLFVIISDGQENSSQKYSTSEIKEMIQERTKEGRWTFTYLGANQDMWKVVKDYGLDYGNVMNFVATSDGMTEAYNIQTRAYGRFFDSVGSTSGTSGRSTMSFYSDALDPVDNKMRKENRYE